MSIPITRRIAVCSWSLQPGSAADLFDRLEATGLTRIQCALDPLREDPGNWADFAGQCRQRGVAVVSGMFGTIGEDYSTLETIRLTGGIVPDATWERNLANIGQCVEIATTLGVGLVSFHAGFLPHDEADPDALKLKGRIEQIAALFAARDIDLALETGQETADTLRSFLETLSCRNVGVNFDPANMLLYGKGDPIEAMQVLAPWIRQVHIKDAVRSAQPGAWGEEVPAGTGEVDWPRFFATLDEMGFNGSCCIEREAGDRRVDDIVTARKLVESFV